MDPTISTKILGDVLSDIWHIYKNSFWKIVAISAIVQTIMMLVIGITLVIVIISVLPLDPLYLMEPSAFPLDQFIGPIVLIFVIALIGGVISYVVMEGAITHAVCQQYVWKQVGISLAFRRTFRRFWPMLGAIIIAGLAVTAMAITIIGIPFAVYFGIRWYFSIQATLLEGASPVEALRGSSELVEDNWWRIVGISIVVGLLIFAITIIPSLILAFIPIVGSFIVNIVVAPAYTIARTVLYCDLRTRAEGTEQFNEEALARDLGLVPVEEEGWSRFNPA